MLHKRRGVDLTGMDPSFSDRGELRRADAKPETRVCNWNLLQQLSMSKTNINANTPVRSHSHNTSPWNKSPDMDNCKDAFVETCTIPHCNNVNTKKVHFSLTDEVFETETEHRGKQGSVYKPARQIQKRRRFSAATKKCMSVCAALNASKCEASESAEACLTLLGKMRSGATDKWNETQADASREDVTQQEC